MELFRKTIVLLALGGGLILSACTSHKSETPPQLGPALMPAGGSTPAFRRQSEVTAVNALHEESYFESGDISQLEINLAESSATLLNAEKMRDPKTQADPNLARLLWDFHRTIIALDKRGPEKLRQSSVVQAYFELITKGCSGILHDCENLEYFRIDAQSVYVLKILAKEFAQNNLSQYYQFLLLAYEMSGGVSDPELDQLFISRSQDYFKSVFQIGTAANSSRVNIKKAPLSRLETERLKAIMGMVETLLVRDAGENKILITESNLREVMSWVINGNFMDVFGKGITEQYIARAAKAMASDSFTAFFRDLVTAREAEPDRFAIDNTTGVHGKGTQVYISSSYSNAGTTVVEKAPKLMKALGLSYQPPSSYTNKRDFLYFYIVSALFRVESFDLINPIWNIIPDHDLNRFLEIMDNYIRVYFANCTYQTNKYISKFFSYDTQSTFRPSNLLEQAQTNTNSEVGPMWKDYFKRIGRVELFFQKEIESRVRSSQNESIKENADKLRNFFREVNNNVKYVVTFPNLLMFTYYAKIYNYKESFYDPSGKTFTIDPQLIMKALMDGEMPTLFVFTNYEFNGRQLNKLEMMYAVYFAVQTGILDLYKVDAADWFSKLFEAYINELNNTDLENWNKELKAELESPLYTGLESDCKALAENRPFANRNIIPIERLRNYTFYGKIGASEWGAYSSDKINNIFSRISPGFYWYKSLSEGLEVIRSDINPKLRNLNLLRELFASDPNVDRKLIGKMDELIKKVNFSRLSIYDKINKYEKFTRSCVFELTKIEHVRRTEMVNFELEFLRHIGTAVSALTMLHGKPGNTGDLRDQFSQHPLWKDTFFADLDPNLPLLEAVNKVIVDKTGLTRMFSSIQAGYRDDYLENGGIRHIGSGQYVFKYRQLDFLLRMANILESGGFNGKRLSFNLDNPKVEIDSNYRTLYTKIYSYNAPNALTVYFPTNENLTEEQKQDLFVRTAALKIMQTDQNSRNVFAYWFFDLGQTTIYYRKWLQFVVAQHKLKFQMDISPGQELNCDAECQNREVIEMRKSSREIINFQTEILKQFNISGNGDDSSLMDYYNINSFYSSWLSSGPAYLFTDTIGNNNRYLGIADDPYNFLISINLGGKPLFRGYRLTPGSNGTPSGADAMLIPQLERAELMAGDGGPGGGGGADMAAKYLRERTDPYEDALNLKRGIYSNISASISETLRKQKDQLLFPIQEKFLKQINGAFISFFHTDMRLIYSFEEELNSLQGNIKLPPMKFDLRVPQFEHDYLLSTELKGRLHYDMIRFNSMSNNVFLPEVLNGNRSWTNITD